METETPREQEQYEMREKQQRVQDQEEIDNQFWEDDRNECSETDFGETEEWQRAEE